MERDSFPSDREHREDQEGDVLIGRDEKNPLAKMVHATVVLVQGYDEPTATCQKMDAEKTVISWTMHHFSSNRVLVVGERDFILKPKMKIENRGTKWIKHYCSKHKILLVGEGDFSFSACLAKAFGSALNMVATSLDSIGVLEMNYEKALRNISELRRRGCTVIHGINARKLAQYSDLRHQKYDMIVFNFPHLGFNLPTSDRDTKIWLHQKLMRSFLSNARTMLAKDGEIHITNKTSAFFIDWELETLASRIGLRLIEQVDFQLGDYPGYNNKYGDGGDRNFDWYPSKTYKFATMP